MVNFSYINLFSQDSSRVLVPFKNLIFVLRKMFGVTSVLPHPVVFMNLLIPNSVTVSRGEKIENKLESKLQIFSCPYFYYFSFESILLIRIYSIIFCSFCRNLVIALKELSIRGDFRTTVEYLITLLETESFQVINCFE